MGQIERLIQSYDTRVSLPWERNLAGSQRVWFAVYNKTEERRLRRRLEEFEISTKRAKHGWLTIDLTDAFAQWLSHHEYRDAYFETPEHLEDESSAVDDFKEAIVRQVADVLTSPKADESTVVAINGVASLFGFMKTSELVSRVETAIRGRLLVFFPGEYENNTFRFLDAREGWNYLAVPITADEGVKPMNLGELFSTNPKNLQLLNNGVAFVKDVVTPEELKTLRFELKTFVCEGAYAKGLEKILRAYLANLDRPEQPAAWVSGFYGSGKSHLGKILRYLWNDFEFPEDKAMAWGLTNLSTEVADLLKELTTAGKRLGGLHAASGTLRGELGDNVRLSMLNIIFKSVGLPPKYPVARFAMWLRDNGKLDAVKNRVQKAGRDFTKELNNLWVSPVLHKALVDEGLGASTSDISMSLAQQFPNVKDITIDDMLQAIREALCGASVPLAKGHGQDARATLLPCTLVVLDEVQQFIGDDSDRSLQIQEIVEACSKQLNSRMLIVATGQSALSGTPQLQKLRDRFRVAIQLSDTDVEAVIRKVITAKKPDKTSTIKKIVSDYEGEVTRHLNGTKIEYRSEDDAAYVPDYPLLPIRRRFWERVLRAVDVAGTAAQLRNQLGIVYESVRTYADRTIETVVGGDFIYWVKTTDLLQTGILQPKIDEMIRKLEDGSADGKLSARICALVFLINKLPREAGADLGIRATADVLADLLVEDLKAGSAELRKKVPELLQSLVQAGQLMVVDEEYRLQTPESASWDAEFKKNFNRIVNDDSRIADERADLLPSRLRRPQGSDSLLRAGLGRAENVRAAFHRPLWLGQ